MQASKNYSREEVNAIIRRALEMKNQDGVSHNDLLETARELGLDDATMELAIDQQLAELKVQDKKNAQIEKRKQKFHQHLWSFIIVNVMLLFINIFSGGGWWFQWAFLGWGIGLLFSFRAAYFPTDDELKKIKS